MSAIRKSAQATTADANVTVKSTGVQIVEHMREYGTYVIEDRAVPDFRDGCKPSQRRLLYAMKMIGITPTGNTVKVSRISGEAMGKFHPHGDASLNQALVDMTHVRYPLVQGQGEFGSAISRAGAARYIEARFHKLANDHFACLDVADMVPNYSATDSEPVVINTRLPLMLMNGASGIAVGMSTNIPSNNLKELVDALIYVAKSKKEATLAGVMQYIKGPDCALGGILTSTQKEIAEVYGNGAGRLEFTCEYRFEKDGDITNIVAFGFPDCFGIQGFISKMEVLAENKIIKYVESDFELTPGKKSDNDKRVIVRIGVDNKSAMEKVLKQLNCAESYQFNVTVRHSSHTELRSRMNILDYMKSWIRWRKGEEKKMLDLEHKKLSESLHRENLRLLGMLNIDAVLAAVKQSKTDPAEHLAKALKLKLEDAQFIGTIPVFQLKKANVEDQKTKIKKLKDEIARVEDDLAHLTRVVIRYLKKLEPYFDERRTKIGVRGPQKSKFETTGDPIVMMASKDGKLFTNVTEKGSTTADVMATASYDGCVVFDESGITSVLSPSECDGKAGPAYKNIVGIAPSEAPSIVVVGKNGNAVKFPGGDSQKQSEFSSIKNTQVVAGFGVTDSSSILVWGKKEEDFACIKASKIKTTRKNTAGSKLVGFKPLRAIAVHESQVLYNNEGTRISITKAGDAVDHKSKLYILDARNIVIYKTGRRKFMDRTTAIKEIARDKSNIRFVYPVSPFMPAGETTA